MYLTILVLGKWQKSVLTVIFTRQVAMLQQSPAAQVAFDTSEHVAGLQQVELHSCK